MGDSVCLRIVGTELDVVTVTERSFTISPECFEKNGIDVKAKHILVGKTLNGYLRSNVKFFFFIFCHFFLIKPRWSQFAADGSFVQRPPRGRIAAAHCSTLAAAPRLLGSHKDDRVRYTVLC